MFSLSVPAASIVCTTADSAQISLLSIYIVSSDEDNDMFTPSSSDTNNSSEKHVFNNSDNADKGFSSHFCKCKFTFKMKVKDKSYIIFTSVIKKQTAAAAKLKLKIALKLKAKFKIKLVK